MEQPKTGRTPRPSVRRANIPTKRASPGDALIEIFFGTPDSPGAYLINNILLPSLKSTISDMVSNGIDILLYGEPSKKKELGESGLKNRGYNTFFKGGSLDTQRLPARTRGPLDEIALSSRSDAEYVLTSLCDIIEEFESATVADYKELVGMRPEHVDYSYGWTNLSKAVILKDRLVYRLELPRARALG